MSKELNLALVSSQGGHSGEMKIIFDDILLKNIKVIFITETQDKNEIGFKEKNFLGQHKTYFLKRDYLLNFNPVRYIYVLVKLIKIFKKESINLIITNGAQISIPAVIAGKIMGIKTIFIDSITRIKTCSLSAIACYPFSDVFLVQHEKMAQKYGKKAKYVGGFI